MSRLADRPRTVVTRVSLLHPVQIEKIRGARWFIATDCDGEPLTCFHRTLAAVFVALGVVP